MKTKIIISGITMAFILSGCAATYSLDGVKYDNKEWCAYTPNGLSKTDLKGRDMDFLVGVNKSSGGYLLPTSCDSIPIWHLIYNFNMLYCSLLLTRIHTVSNI